MPVSLHPNTVFKLIYTSKAFNLFRKCFTLFLIKTMAIRMPRIVNAKKIIQRSSLAANRAVSSALDVPKGYLAVYIGESERKRCVIPVAYLNQPSFQDLLSQAEEEFGFEHPMGGLTIPCRENIFIISLIDWFKHDTGHLQSS